jgi:hypothetical protein
MSNPSLREPAPARKSGQTFNPHRDSCGFYASDIIARQRDLGDGPKRLYDRLVRWAGQNGTCWYGYERMATELGKCVRQVKSDVAALEHYHLIQHQRRGKKLSNVYSFLWHPLFDGAAGQPVANPEPATRINREGQPNAHHAKSEGQNPSSDGQPTVPSEVQPAAHEFCKENFVKRIASSSAEQERGALETTESADDDALSQGITENTVLGCLTEFVEAIGIAPPVGKIPAAEIADGLSQIGATVEEFIRFLRGYAGHLKEAPATWKHLRISFERWANDPKTLETIRSRLAWEVAEERRQRCTAEREQTMSVATACCGALAMLPDVKTPWPIEARLERTGEPISPNELAELARNWQRCPKCRDRGTSGNAIDRDLRFCSCLAGEEASHRDGRDCPEREIARTHADTRSLIAAACYEQEMLFTGDAIGEAEVRDDGSTVTIIRTLWHARIGAIREDDIARALTRVGWRRTVEICPALG